MKLKPIEELAHECGAERVNSTITMATFELEAMRTAIIKDFVESLDPVYWRWGDPKNNVWIYADEEPVIKSGNYTVQELYALSEWEK